MKSIYAITFVAAALGVAGCNKQLEKDPIGLITVDQVNSEPTPTIVQSSVTASYKMLANTLNIIGQWDWTNGTVLRNDFIIQDMASDDMQKKWNPDGDQPWMDDVVKFNFSTSNGGFNGIWSYDYEGIARANKGIAFLTNAETITKIGMAEALKNRLLGEVYFLRSMYYFDLVTNFGDVPMILTPLKDFNEAYKVAVRTPKDKVWAQIKDDLTKASTLLPNSKYSSTDEKWRASKGAAIAMLAKTALYNKQWQDVITQVGALETLGFYSLNSHYFDSFNYRKEFAENEVIFAYNHESGKTPSNGNGISALIDWGFIAPTQDFINTFEPNDPRLAYTVNTSIKTAYKLLGDTTTAFKGNDDAPGNKVFIRWADVLLWKAEAYIETSSLPAAIAIINSIRQRARTTPDVITKILPPAGTLPARDVATTDKALVKQWLMHERRVELGFESQRFNDLKRWGTAKDVLRAVGKNFQDKNYVYPIPQGEIDKSGKTIVQNKDY